MTVVEVIPSGEVVAFASRDAAVLFAVDVQSSSDSLCVLRSL